MDQHLAHCRCAATRVFKWQGNDRQAESLAILSVIALIKIILLDNGATDHTCLQDLHCVHDKHDQMLVRFDVMVVHHSYEHEWVIRSECVDCNQAGESGQLVEIALVATDMAD